MLSQAKLQTIICTTDLSAAARFYGDLLDLPLQSTSDGALVFLVGGSQLRVSPVPSMTRSEHTVVGFAVDDIAGSVRWLQQLGLTLERFDGFSHDARGVLTTPDGAQVVWFRDPDGNLLSVVEFAAQ